jgi:hypothetical protein
MIDIFMAVVSILGAIWGTVVFTYYVWRAGTH